MKRDAARWNDVEDLFVFDYIFSVLGRVDGGELCKNSEPSPGGLCVF